MLSLQDVHGYYGKSHIVKGISLDATPGEVIALIGRNGVGKTTLLKAMMSIIAKKGSVILDGKNIEDFESHRVARAGIGYVPQGRHIFPQLTVSENLATGWWGKGAPPVERLEEIFELFPALSALLTRRAGWLSGGEQQMLAIGRAIISKPKVVVMDEPTEGLSPLYVENVERVIHIMRNRNIPILVVEQNLLFIQNVATSFVIQEGGKIVYKGGSPKAWDEDIINKYLAVTV